MLCSLQWITWTSRRLAQAMSFPACQSACHGLPLARHRRGVEGVRNLMGVEPLMKVAAWPNRDVTLDEVFLPAEQQPALENPDRATERRVVGQVKRPKSGQTVRGYRRRPDFQENRARRLGTGRSTEWRCTITSLSASIADQA